MGVWIQTGVMEKEVWSEGNQWDSLHLSLKCN